MTTWRTGFIPRGRDRVYDEAAGEGPALVLCHGLGGNHAVWYQQVVEFASDHLVVTWDQRGFGRSTREEGFGPDAAVGDLLALLDHLEIERAHLVGQSMGGWCVAGLALGHPERAHSLVLADTLGGMFTEELLELIRRDGELEPPPDPPELGVHPAIRGLDRRDSAQAFLYQELSSFGADVPTMEMITLLTGVRHDPAALARLGIPTLFVFGSEDQLFPPSALRRGAELAGAPTVVEIAGSAHSPYFEDAPAWNRVVREFLADVD